MELKNSKTLENLKAGFAGESQANRRYLLYSDQQPMARQLTHSDISSISRQLVTP